MLLFEWLPFSPSICFFFFLCFVFCFLFLFCFVLFVSFLHSESYYPIICYVINKLSDVWVYFLYHKENIRLAGILQFYSLVFEN